MKPSQLPKDGNFSGRINKQVQELLRKKGISVQDIIDAYIDNLIKVETIVKWKRGENK